MRFPMIHLTWAAALAGAFLSTPAFGLYEGLRPQDAPRPFQAPDLFHDAGDTIFWGPRLPHSFQYDLLHGHKDCGSGITEIRFYCDDDCDGHCHGHDHGPCPPPSNGGGPVPEPANILLMGLSLLGLVGRSAWRRG